VALHPEAFFDVPLGELGLRLPGLALALGEPVHGGGIQFERDRQRRHGRQSFVRARQMCS
jgi:hypothetical protein